MMDSEQKREEFVNDWNAMVATLANFSNKWQLPKGEIIFPPQVFSVLQSVSQERLLPTLINQGIRVRFGKFEQSDVFRSL